MLANNQISLQISQAEKLIKDCFYRAKKTQVVIAVSGGIDSAVSVSLCVRALGKENVHPILLPYDSQDMTDAMKIVEHWQIPQSNYYNFQIKPSVDLIAKTVGISIKNSLNESLNNSQSHSLRLGNIMARVRMIFIYDLAKKLDAMVVGTENKSEKYLGYFTRFGDEASDLEPIQQWYKTEIRQVAKLLKLPDVFLTKAPSAGLWAGQTDEQELGFSYDQADQVLQQLIDQKISPEDISLAGDENREIVKVVLARVAAAKFKLEVPYHL